MRYARTLNYRHYVGAIRWGHYGSTYRVRSSWRASRQSWRAGGRALTTAPRPRRTSRVDVLDALRAVWEDAAELWHAHDVAPLQFAYERLCRVAGDEWGDTLREEDAERFMRDTLG